MRPSRAGAGGGAGGPRLTLTLVAEHDLNTAGSEGGQWGCACGVIFILTCRGPIFFHCL